MIAVLYLLIFAVLLCFFFVGWMKTKRKYVYSKREKYDTNTISIIIPFRNEATNIPYLVEAISTLTKQPLEFIWVNDHSEDGSELLIQHLPENHQLISLDKNITGKKSAIRAGIKRATGSYILTWDADCIVPSTYFETLEQTPVSTLTILPVAMHAQTVWEIFYELDYYFLSSINVGLSGFTQPLVASGANLLFEKASFLEVDSIAQHQHIASGDDQFLLVDFKKAKKSIQVIPAFELCVITKTPHTLTAFFQQRLRWIGKSSYIKDNPTRIISSVGLTYVVLFVCLLFTTHWMIILCSKIIIDVLIFLPYLHALKRKKTVWFLPIFTLIYPVYCCVIGLLMLVVKPKWKGRL